MTKAHLICCINAAELAGFTHYAASLRHLCEREYPAPPQPLPDFADAVAPQKSGQTPGGQQAATGSTSSVFRSVTGRDFGRSLAWARRTPNRVADQIREHRQRVQAGTPYAP